MSESPIFVKLYDLQKLLLPQTLKFSREYRFSLALPIQEHLFALQRHLVSAAKALNRRDSIHHLQQADVELTLLRYKLRLSRDLDVLKLKGYEHAGRQLDEIGRLLGGWQKKLGMDSVGTL